MAEGGYDGDKDTDPLISKTDDPYKDSFGDATFPDQPNGSSTPKENIQMKTFLQEQSSLPKKSYIDITSGETSETSGRSVTTEELERRLADLKNPITGLLDTSRVGLHEQLLSEEDKNREIEKTKDFIKKRYPNADLSKLNIKFSTKKLWILLSLVPGVVRQR